MKSKNSFIFNHHKVIFGNGLLQKGINEHMAPNILNNNKERIVNSATFGRILGSKVEGDNTKLGNFSKSENITTTTSSNEISDLSNALQKINFKSKNKKQNIKLEI